MTVRTEVTDGVALVTLDRPERHNAVDLATAVELADTWRAFRFDDTVRAAVLTGAGGRAFCTGIDRSVDVPQPSSPTPSTTRCSTSARRPTTCGSR